MNKTELVSAMAEKSGLTKTDAEKALSAFTDVVSNELKKREKVQILGFGNFETAERAARNGINPKTGEKLSISATTAAKFKAGKTLKDFINL